MIYYSLYRKMINIKKNIKKTLTNDKTQDIIFLACDTQGNNLRHWAIAKR